MRAFSIYSICTLLPLTVGAQSSVNLSNGNRLTGEIQQLDENGECQMALSTSGSRVTIKSGLLQNITFQASNEEGHAYSESVTLTNGDTLPCSILSLKDELMLVDTNYAGQLSISRGNIHSLAFNNSKNAALYDGPNLPSEWDQLTNWEIADGTMLASNNAEASMKLPLPRNFSVSFLAKWQGDRPKFKLYLCADSQSQADIRNFYYIDFNVSNIKIHRSTPSRMNQIIGEIPIRLKDISRRSAHVEVRVDRELQQISIIVNGQELGIYDDTEINAPKGDWTLLQAQMQNDGLSLSSIKVTETSSNHFEGRTSSDPLNEEKDTFYDIEAQTYSGKLLDITNTPELATLNFAHKLSSEPMTIPLVKAHSLYFAKVNEKPTKKANYTIELQGGGLLELNRLSIDEESATALHPLLGELTLKRESLTSLTKKTVADEK